VTHAVKVDVVLDAGETVAVGDLVLVEKDLVGALERRGNDESAALVVEGGKQNRRRSDLWRGCEFGARGGAARDGDYVCGRLGRGWDGLQVSFETVVRVQVVLLGDEGVDAFGGCAVSGGAIGGRVVERSVLERGAAGNRTCGNDDAGFAAGRARARRKGLRLRWFVGFGLGLVAREQRRWKQGKAEERRRGVMGRREAH